MSSANLKATSGLDINLDTVNYRLAFSKDSTAPQPAVRTIGQMQEVLMDKTVAGPQDLYYMYRDVYLVKDEALLKKYNLRYDVTVIKPDPLGKELMKTAGHYHPGSFGELYEVVFGHALCMLQKPNKENFRIIEDVILVFVQLVKERFGVGHFRELQAL